MKQYNSDKDIFQINPLFSDFKYILDAIHTPLEIQYKK